MNPKYLNLHLEERIKTESVTFSKKKRLIKIWMK